MKSVNPGITALFLIATLTVTTASAQSSTSAGVVDPPREEWNSVMDALRGHEWADQINNLHDIMRVMPDSLYGFSPLDGMRSFGALVGHISNVMFGFCDRISGRDGPERSDLELAEGKTAALEGLMTAVETCDVLFDELTDEQLVANQARFADNITTMMGHNRRETGKLVTYLRLAGVTPPELLFRRGRLWRH